MEKSYAECPPNYQTIFEIDFANNKKEFKLLNYGSNLMFIPFIVLYLLLDQTLTVKDGARFLIVFWLSILGMLVVIMLHELVHGLFFKIYGKGKLKFKFHGFAFSCSMPTHYFQKGCYLVIGLAPLVILSLLLGSLSILYYKTDYFLLFYAPFVFNFCGSLGDMYVAYRLRKCSKTVLISDQGIKMVFLDLVKP